MFDSKRLTKFRRSMRRSGWRGFKKSLRVATMEDLLRTLARLLKERSASNQFHEKQLEELRCENHQLWGVVNAIDTVMELIQAPTDEISIGQAYSLLQDAKAALGDPEPP